MYVCVCVCANSIHIHSIIKDSVRKPFKAPPFSCSPAPCTRHDCSWNVASGTPTPPYPRPTPALPQGTHALKQRLLSKNLFRNFHAILTHFTGFLKIGLDGWHSGVSHFPLNDPIPRGRL